MPKKGNGIYQRRDGRYEAIHYYGINPATGRPKKLTRYGKTAKEAKKSSALPWQSLQQAQCSTTQI